MTRRGYLKLVLGTTLQKVDPPNLIYEPYIIMKAVKAKLK